MAIALIYNEISFMIRIRIAYTATKAENHRAICHTQNSIQNYKKIELKIIDD